METVVISDASCLVILDKIGYLSLLRRSYQKVLITSIVASEYGNELPDWVSVQSPQQSALQKLLEETIDAGEASSIALAIELKDCYLILDDLRARKVATAMGLNITGTLGIIASAKKRGLIPVAKPIFELILQTDFRVSEQLLEEILRELEEL